VSWPARPQSDFCASTVVCFFRIRRKNLKNPKLSVLLGYLTNMEANDWIEEELNPQYPQELLDANDVLVLNQPVIEDAIVAIPWSICKTKRGAYQVCTDGRKFQIKKSARRLVPADPDYVPADDGDDEGAPIDHEEFMHHLTLLLVCLRIFQIFESVVLQRYYSRLSICAWQKFVFYHFHFIFAFVQLYKILNCCYLMLII